MPFWDLLKKLSRFMPEYFSKCFSSWPKRNLLIRFITKNGRIKLFRLLELDSISKVPTAHIEKFLVWDSMSMVRLKNRQVNRDSMSNLSKFNKTLNIIQVSDFSGVRFSGNTTQSVLNNRNDNSMGNNLWVIEYVSYRMTHIVWFIPDQTIEFDDNTDKR